VPDVATSTNGCVGKSRLTKARSGEHRSAAFMRIYAASTDEPAGVLDLARRAVPQHNIALATSRMEHSKAAGFRTVKRHKCRAPPKVRPRSGEHGSAAFMRHLCRFNGRTCRRDRSIRRAVTLHKSRRFGHLRWNTRKPRGFRVLHAQRLVERQRQAARFCMPSRTQ